MIKLDLTNYELNIMLDALDDCLEKVTHSTQIDTDRKYRRTIRIIQAKIEAELRTQ